LLKAKAESADSQESDGRGTKRKKSNGSSSVSMGSFDGTEEFDDVEEDLEETFEHSSVGNNRGAGAVSRTLKRMYTQGSGIDAEHLETGRRSGREAITYTKEEELRLQQEQEAAQQLSLEQEEAKVKEAFMRRKQLLDEVLRTQVRDFSATSSITMSISSAMLMPPPSFSSGLADDGPAGTGTNTGNGSRESGRSSPRSSLGVPSADGEEDCSSVAQTTHNATQMMVSENGVSLQRGAGQRDVSVTVQTQALRPMLLNTKILTKNVYLRRKVSRQEALRSGSIPMGPPPMPPNALRRSSSGTGSAATAARNRPGELVNRFTAATVVDSDDENDAEEEAAMMRFLGE
jgi:hypothetical protein